jgi:threonine synthase
MYLSHLECSKCSVVFDSDAILHLCNCGAPLLVRYGLKKIKEKFSKETLINPPGPWVLTTFFSFQRTIYYLQP